MRLFIIEKKTAAKYESTPDDRADSGSDSDLEGSEPSESDPLISKKSEEEAYKVSPGSHPYLRKFPIAYVLKDPRLLVALLLAFVQATLLSSFDNTIPTVASSYFAFDSLKAGLLFIALVLPYLLLGPIAGWLVDRYGTKPAGVIGFGYLVPVLILLRVPHAGGTDQIVIFCAILALCGVGLAIIGSPSIVEASFVVQKYDKANPEFFGEQGPYAQLYGLNSMVFSAGLTLGPLLSGGVKESAGYGNANLVLAVLCLVTAVLSYVFVGGYPEWVRKRWRRRS